jgi:hypothetical protein
MALRVEAAYWAAAHEMIEDVTGGPVASSMKSIIQNGSTRRSVISAPCISRIVTPRGRPNQQLVGWVVISEMGTAVAALDAGAMITEDWLAVGWTQRPTLSSAQ